MDDASMRTTMKLQWLYRDNPHAYRKKRPRRRQAGHEWIYECVNCMSWMGAAHYENPRWQLHKRPVVNFCSRGQGMLFDRIFRTGKET